ncbi:MAG: DNA polymerase III subunit beta [Pseudanabaenaceae cyanobacterium]
MRLTCRQNHLATNLSLVSRAVASRPSHPILANIYLHADTEHQLLGLKAFDLSLGIQVSFPAEVQESGAFTLPAKLLNDIVSRLPDEDVSIVIDQDSSMAMLTCGSGRYQLHGLPVEEFPELPEISDAGQLTYLPVEALISGLNGTLFATSTDEGKRVLTGVRLVANGETLEFAATDGHRLSVVETNFLEVDDASDAPVATTMEVTIPARALRELEKVLNQQTEGAIAVRFDEANMIFHSANQTLVSRLLDGSYPNYRQLIPNRFERQVAVDRKLLISALERIGVLDQKGNIVKVTIDANAQEIALSVDSPDVATGKESLPAQVSGEDMEIAFNVKYLLEGLKAISGSEVHLQLNTPTSPVILTPISAMKMTYLLMPVQIRN